MKKIIILFAVLISITAKSQTISAPEDLNLSIELLHELQIPEAVADTLLDPMSLLSTSDTVLLKVSMDILDTVNISKIHVKLGTTDGGNELLEHIFDYDNTSPGGAFTYNRDEEFITIGMGLFTYRNIFYIEVFFEDNQGTNSDVVKYQSN